MKLIKIKVYPNKPITKLREEKRDGVDFVIDLKAQKEKNKANTELIKFLADFLNVNRADIKIVNGAKASVKTVEVKDKR